jgi:hypothetical protein
MEELTPPHFVIEKRSGLVAKPPLKVPCAMTLRSDRSRKACQYSGMALPTKSISVVTLPVPGTRNGHASLSSRYVSTITLNPTLCAVAPRFLSVYRYKPVSGLPVDEPVTISSVWVTSMSPTRHTLRLVVGETSVGTCVKVPPLPPYLQSTPSTRTVVYELQGTEGHA